MRERGKGTEPSVDERYTQWKSLVPVLYDWLANHNLVWPSLSCRLVSEDVLELLGGVRSSSKPLTRIVNGFTFRNRQDNLLLQCLNLSFMADCEGNTDGSVPNTLVIANCEVVKPRVAAAEHISQFNEEARSPFVKKYKTIIHPGEVNRIRELPQNCKIVATHTDSPDVLIWDVEAQPNRHAVLGATNSRPDLDKSVVLWSIHDHISTLAAEAATKSPGSGATNSKHSSKVGGSTDKTTDSPSIGPRGIYQGHTDTVEDVQFCPTSAQEFCSVGDDSCLILWDARVGSTPAAKVEKAHDGDLHCVDWNPHDVNYILTGSADATVHMFDRRNLASGEVGSPVHKFEGHNAAVLCVQWSPDKSSVFGSSAEDGILNIWDHEKVGKKQDPVGSKMANVPPGLFFRHAGHRDKVVDFHWNASDPWTIVSVSDDCESTGGGGTLQIWRMIDLIYRPEEEVLSELEKFKSHILTCSS
ncbi:WD-40 repeat-containing protein MSI4 [Morella rubra]|uniref:WD-40 repeat-containing protein MSI4 n=1 Tax=Morella rubra TaxID=262757 RepID=A0A6A1W6N2_9ROSI|nr:WD-40 repeat-containing protein MSI4 [Morella rubra]